MRGAFAACICSSERGLISSDHERPLVPLGRCDHRFLDQCEENSVWLTMLVELAGSSWRKRDLWERLLGSGSRAPVIRGLSAAIELVAVAWWSSWFEAGCWCWSHFAIRISIVIMKRPLSLPSAPSWSLAAAQNSENCKVTEIEITRMPIELFHSSTYLNLV